MNMSILPQIGFMLLVGFLIMLNFIRNYKTGTIEKALVIYGKLDPENKLQFKVLTKGSTFVWPILQKYYYFWLDSYPIESTEIFMDKNNLKHKISFELNIQPSQNEADLHLSISKLFGKNKGEISDILKNRIELMIRREVSKKGLNEENYKLVLKTISKNINEELSNYGFSQTMSNVFVDTSNFN